MDPLLAPDPQWQRQKERQRVEANKSDEHIHYAGTRNWKRTCSNQSHFRSRPYRCYVIASYALLLFLLCMAALRLVFARAGLAELRCQTSKFPDGAEQREPCQRSDLILWEPWSNLSSRTSRLSPTAKSVVKKCCNADSAGSELKSSGHSMLRCACSVTKLMHDPCSNHGHQAPIDMVLARS